MIIQTVNGDINLPKKGDVAIIIDTDNRSRNPKKKVEILTNFRKKVYGKEVVFYSAFVRVLKTNEIEKATIDIFEEGEGLFLGGNWEDGMSETYLRSLSKKYGTRKNQFC